MSAARQSIRNDDYVGLPKEFRPVSVKRALSRKDMLHRLSKLLETAKIGIQLYAVGDETFLGLITRLPRSMRAGKFIADAVTTSF